MKDKIIIKFGHGQLKLWAVEINVKVLGSSGRQQSSAFGVI